MEDVGNEIITSFLGKIESLELSLAGKALLQRVLSCNKGVGIS